MDFALLSVEEHVLVAALRVHCDNVRPFLDGACSQPPATTWRFAAQPGTADALVVHDDVTIESTSVEGCHAMLPIRHAY